MRRIVTISILAVVTAAALGLATATVMANQHENHHLPPDRLLEVEAMMAKPAER